MHRQPLDNLIQVRYMQGTNRQHQPGRLRDIIQLQLLDQLGFTNMWLDINFIRQYYRAIYVVPSAPWITSVERRRRRRRVPHRIPCNIDSIQIGIELGRQYPNISFGRGPFG